MDEGVDRGIGRRELVESAATGLVLAVVSTWPLLLRLGSHVPADLGDPLIEARQLAWSGHALRTDPGSLWESNILFPARDAFAFTDSLLGLLPLSLVGSGPTAALVRYNVAFLLGLALCFTAPALLARELGIRRGAAYVAGAVFAYAPWRGSHLGHLNVLFVPGIPLTAFLLLRGYRRGSPWLVFAGWTAALWQISIGFAMGIPFGYALAAGTLAGLGVWWRKGFPRPSRAVVVAGAAGLVLLAAGTFLLARPYQRVADRHPTALRTEAALRRFSPEPRSFLVAPPGNRFWGERTKPIRDELRWAPEQALFPGLLALGFAVVGLRGGPLPRGMRIGLASVVAGTAVLSLGTGFLDGRWTYLPLFEHAPGWQALRTPGRLSVYTSLALGLLAAAGCQRMLTAVRVPTGRYQQSPGMSESTLRGAVAATVVAVAVFEGAALVPQRSVPKPPSGWTEIAGPAVHLPTSFGDDARYTYWSTAGFGPMANGEASFVPPEWPRMRRLLEAFPDARSVEALRAAGIRQVVVHPTRLRSTKYRDVLSRSYDGLPLSVEQVGELVVYTVNPPTSPS